MGADGDVGDAGDSEHCGGGGMGADINCDDISVC